MTSIARGITKFSQTEIKFLFEKAFRHDHCAAFVLLRAQQQNTVGKILIVTPKKIGHAPDRNLIRRRAKSIFMREKGFEKGFDWVLIVRKKALSLSFVDLHKKLQNSFCLP